MEIQEPISDNTEDAETVRRATDNLVRAGLSLAGTTVIYRREMKTQSPGNISPQRPS